MASTDQTVAVLCASRKSVYFTLPNVEVYDRNRDARTFVGGMPVVAHPPCRAWSAFVKHQAKPDLGEIELGLWCCEQLRQCGGVLEQPEHSGLFMAGNLPMAGEARGDLWTIGVWQAWWGYPMKKATWLCFSRIKRDALEIPFCLHAAGADRRRQQRMSHRQRSETTLAFAEWLVNVARSVARTGPEGGG